MLDLDGCASLGPAATRAPYRRGAYLGTPDELLARRPGRRGAAARSRAACRRRARGARVIMVSRQARSWAGRAPSSRGGCRGSRPPPARGRRGSSPCAGCRRPDLVGDGGQRAAQDLLVGPARAGHDGGGAVVAVVRAAGSRRSRRSPASPRCSTSVAPWAARPASSSPGGMRRGPRAVAGEDHRLGDAREGQLAAQRAAAAARRRARRA